MKNVLFIKLSPLLRESGNTDYNDNAITRILDCRNNLYEHIKAKFEDDHLCKENILVITPITESLGRQMIDLQDKSDLVIQFNSDFEGDIKVLKTRLDIVGTANLILDVAETLRIFKYL